ncbi:MAG: lipase family protein [Myxococcota bacterium]
MRRKGILRLFHKRFANLPLQLKHLTAISPEHPCFDPSHALTFAMLSDVMYLPQKEAVELLKSQYSKVSLFEQQGIAGVLLEQKNFAVLAFRGTQLHSVQNLWMDMQIQKTRSFGAYVHAGFKRALDAVWEPIHIKLEKIQKPVFFTGHSLGGVLAKLAGFRWFHEQERLVQGVYAFGAPSPGDRSFSKMYNCTPLGKRTWRVHDEGDLLSRTPLSFLQYYPVGCEIRIDAEGQLVRLPRSVNKTLHVHWFKRIREQFSGPFAFVFSTLLSLFYVQNHMPRSYLKKISEYHASKAP